MGQYHTVVAMLADESTTSPPSTGSGSAPAPS